MRIAVDTEGGDHSPEPHALAALDAVRSRADLSVLLHTAERHRACVASLLRGEQRVEIATSPYAAPMKASTEDQVMEWARKPTTMAAAVHAVRRDEADAMLTSGNTGIFAMSAMSIGRHARHKGRRPSLLLRIPTPAGTVLLTDAGLGKEIEPEHLVDFSHTALDLAPFLLGSQAQYTIGTLSMGREPGKGMPQVVEGARRIAAAGLPWKGNVEPNDVLQGVVAYEEDGEPRQEKLDIAVAHGPFGNMLLKTWEATPASLGWLAKEAVAKNRTVRRFPLWLLQLAAGAVMLPTMRAAKATAQAHVGAAMIAGLKKFALKVHGGSGRDAIRDGILFADTIARDWKDREEKEAAA